jgi:PAS domain S-box-containing protein
MKNPEQKNHSSKALGRLFIIAPLALLLFALIFSWWSYNREKRDQIKNLSNITELAEKAVDTYLTQLSNDLLGLSQDIAAAVTSSHFERPFLQVKRYKELHPELRNITLMREDGQVLLTARNAPRPNLPSLAGEPSFQQFRTEFQQGKPLSIGRPLISLINREWIIPLRVAVRNKEGQATHFLSANLPVEMLQNFWKAAPFTKPTALGLMRDDGFLISRYPIPGTLNFADIYGKPITGVLINFLKQANFPVKGVVEGRSSLDGPKYLTVFQRLEHFPITLFLAMPQSEILAGWWDKVRIPYLLAALLFIGSLFFYYLSLKQQQDRAREQQQAAEVLRQSEEKYRNVFAAEDDALFLIDRETGAILEANESACALYGYQAEEWLRMKNWEVSAEPEMTRQATKDTPREIPLRYHKKKDGTVFPVDITSSTFKINNRTVILAAIRDITERRKAEEALKKSEERLRHLIESSHDWIWEVNREGVYTYASDRCRDLLGHEPEELIGKTPFDLMPEAEAERVRPIFSSFISARKAFSRLENINRHKDGRRVVLETNGVPFFDEAGRFQGYRGMDRDITKRRLAEETLRESEEKFRFLAENMADIVWTTDMELRSTYVSPSVERVFGFTEEERKRQTPEEMVTPETLRKFLVKYKKAMALEGQPGTDPDRPTTLEGDYYRKDGSTIPMEIRVRAERDGQGKMIGLIGVSRPIAERRQAEEERMILSKLESAGILAGGIAHDFNNLLSVILGNLDQIKLFELSETERNQLLEAIRTAAMEAGNLTKQLITLAQGGDPLIKPIYLSNLLQDRSIQALRGSQARADFSLPADLWPVEADEGQIGQVIRGLVLNAREAMPEGGTVSVLAENMQIHEHQTTLPLKPGRYVRVRISDEGPGIPENIFPKIFDPYFSTKERGIQKGMGLGLTICRSIIQKHRGALTIETLSGKGTTVTFYLPAGNESASINPPVSRRPTEKKRIMVMDDEEMVRKMTGAILSKLGYEVVLVENGEKAIERYQGEKEAGRPLDAVIMDLTIRGGLGGLETLRRLLLIDPEVKAIVASGYAQDPVMQNYAGYGFRAALAKPFMIAELTAELAQVLE